VADIIAHREAAPAGIGSTGSVIAGASLGFLIFAAVEVFGDAVVSGRLRGALR
jgi:hypothetical protein